MRRCRRPHCPGDMTGRPKQAKYHNRRCGQAHHAHIVAGTTVRLVAPKVVKSRLVHRGFYRVWLDGVDEMLIKACSEMQARTRARMSYSRRKS